MQTEVLTKSKVERLMKANGIKGEVRGRGRDFEVEVPNEHNKTKLRKAGVVLGGYRTGYGAWVLRPGYTASGDWNDKSSHHHY